MESDRIPKKRGQLSLDEEAYIRDNVNSLSVDQIASNLNRHSGPIKRYISENNWNNYKTETAYNPWGSDSGDRKGTYANKDFWVKEFNFKVIKASEILTNYKK